ncbi:MAG: FecR domain-containing protein, partial [Elusimicrobia bacterium]|nr:FecR domain-containing protein [Elusimicrobiota bacterium]
MTSVMLAAALAAAAPARAQEPPALVSYVLGPVSAGAAGRRRTVKAGDALADGDTVSAGPGAAAVVTLPDGSKLKLRERTSLTLRLHPDARGLTGVFLSLGGVFASVAHGSSPHFAVVTPHAVAAVRGTEFFTSYGRGRDLWVCVGRGTVELS